MGDGYAVVRTRVEAPVNITVRALAVTTAAALVVPLWAVPTASAAAKQEPAANGAYFSSTGAPDTGTDAGKLPPVTRPADGVAEGNLAVAARAGQTDKATYLRFDLADLEPGSTITKAQLRVPLAEGDGNVVIAPAAVKVRACPAGPEGFSNEQGESLAVAPEALCDTASAAGADSADKKAYVFDITAIAAEWADMNDGVALVPAEGADSTNFQVVFAGPEQAILTYEATPPADSPGTGFDAAPADDFAGPADDGAAVGGGTGDTGGSFDAGFAEVPSDSGGFGAVDAPLIGAADVPAEVPADVPVEDPVAAGDPSAETVATQNVAFSERTTPTAGFWLAGLLFAAVLALMSLIMGDPRLPQAGGRQSRLSQALAAQQAGRGRSSLGGPATG